MGSHHPVHTGHELSRARAHEGERDTHDKGGHQGGHGKPAGPVDIEKALHGLRYPASRDEIVAQAEVADVAPELMQRLRQMADAEYDSPASIAHEVNKAG